WIVIHPSLNTLDLSVNPVVQCRRTWYQFSRAHIPLFRSTNDGIGRPVVVQHLCISPVDKCIGSAPFCPPARVNAAGFISRMSVAWIIDMILILICFFILLLTADSSAGSAFDFVIDGLGCASYTRRNVTVGVILQL